MKIGFDVSQTAESKAGCGFYSDQLIRALAKIDDANEYILFPWFYDYRPKDTHKATQIEQKNFQNIIINDFKYDNEILKSLEIIHSNNFRYPENIDAKKIVTIYDTCFIDYPEYTTEANRLFCYKGTFDSVLKADCIIAISHYTKKRLVHFFPSITENKIKVIHCGNRDTLLKEKDNYKLLDKYGLNAQEFYLSVGTIEPRKNYHYLLNAYCSYKDKVKTHKKLCIAGGYGWMEEKFKQRIDELGLSNDVIVTGYVSDSELANLYKYCFAFTYPSWYEGFGLPVLEAMNFKKPVITSNVTSIPEVTGDKAILINPLIEEEMVNGLLRLEEDSDFYRKLSIEGYERSKVFSWSKAAKEIINIYKMLV